MAAKKTSLFDDEDHTDEALAMFGDGKKKVYVVDMHVTAGGLTFSCPQRGEKDVVV